MDVGHTYRCIVVFRFSYTKITNLRFWSDLLKKHVHLKKLTALFQQSIKTYLTTLKHHIPCLEILQTLLQEWVLPDVFLQEGIQACHNGSLMNHSEHTRTAFQTAGASGFHKVTSIGGLIKTISFLLSYRILHFTETQRGLSPDNHLTVFVFRVVNP